MDYGYAHLSIDKYHFKYHLNTHMNLKLRRYPHSTLRIHQRARHLRPRGHQEVPLQRRRSTTRTPQTKHGVVHRNHRKSTPQTRQRRARSRREARHDLGLMLKMDTE